MQASFVEFRNTGVNKVVFGDLFLEDVRRYRDRLLGNIGMTALYPIWGRDTKSLAREFIQEGFRAVMVCIDPRFLDGSFAGRMFDAALLKDLPGGVDPCGENGEFHTFVVDGPIFRAAVRFLPGPVVSRENFYFADLLPESGRNDLRRKAKPTRKDRKA